MAWTVQFQIALQNKTMILSSVRWTFVRFVCPGWTSVTQLLFVVARGALYDVTYSLSISTQLVVTGFQLQRCLVVLQTYTNTHLLLFIARISYKAARFFQYHFIYPLRAPLFLSLQAVAASGPLQLDSVIDWTAETQHMQCQWAVAVACLSFSQPA